MEIERFDVSPHLSHAIRYNGLVFVSGQVCDSVEAGIEIQTHEILAKLEKRLRAAGSAPGRILFAQVWLRDMKDRDAFNAIWIPWIGSNPSARACVEARLADARMLAEVALVAAANHSVS